MPKQKEMAATPGRDGTGILVGIEFLQFGDRKVKL
jgi:hypothetical protein